MADGRLKRTVPPGAEKQNPLKLFARKPQNAGLAKSYLVVKTMHTSVTLLRDFTPLRYKKNSATSPTLEFVRTAPGHLGRSWNLVWNPFLVDAPLSIVCTNRRGSCVPTAVACNHGHVLPYYMEEGRKLSMKCSLHETVRVCPHRKTTTTMMAKTRREQIGCEGEACTSCWST